MKERGEAWKKGRGGKCGSVGGALWDLKEERS